MEDLVLSGVNCKCSPAAFRLFCCRPPRLIQAFLCLYLLVLQSQRGVSQHHEDPMMNFSEGHHHHHEEEENLDGVWKGLTALSGVYFMFLIEHFLTLGKMYKDKKQKVKVGSDFSSCLLL